MGAIRERRSLITSIVTAMATKPFLIFSGISGSGKTQLARRLAAGIAAGPLAQGSYMRTLPQHGGSLASTLAAALRGSGVSPQAFDPATTAEYVDVHPLQPPPNAHNEPWERDQYGRTRPGPALESYRDVLENRIAFLAVRPDWKDASQIWGTYNPLTGLFYPTRALRVVLHALLEFLHLGDRAGRHFLIFDEMNLSRVEYYLSDLLSLMESGARVTENGQRQMGEMIEVHPFHAPLWCGTPPRIPGERSGGAEMLYQGQMNIGWARAMALLSMRASNLTFDPVEVDFAEIIGGADWFRLVPPQLCFPPNLAILGTVNLDETTHAFAPKVLDRAFVIEFAHLNFEAVCGNWTGYRSISEEILVLQRILEPAQLHFGYRVVQEWLAYLQASGRTWAQEGDFLISSKVLPRIRGTAPQLENALRELLAYCIGIEVTQLSRGSGHWECATRWEKALTLLGLSPREVPHPRSAQRVFQMLRELFTTGVTSFL